MMRQSLTTLTLIAALAASASAGSQNDAGCGLGAQLFKENRPTDQVLAATTNGCFGTQTFGITTGTLGCTSGGVIRTSREREVFTATNFRALQVELASGRGEYEDSLAAMTGCKPDQFAPFAKAHYTKLIPSEKTTPQELLSNIDREIESDSTMSKACVR